MLGIDRRYPNFVGGFASFSRLERVTGGATNCTATDAAVRDRPARDTSDRAGLVVLGEVDAGAVDRRGVAGRANVDRAGREAGCRADDARGAGEVLGDDLGEVLEEPCRRHGVVEDLMMLGVAEVVADLVEREEVALAERERDLVDARGLLEQHGALQALAVVVGIRPGSEHVDADRALDLGQRVADQERVGRRRATARR